MGEAFYLVNMYNGYKFIGKFRTYEEVKIAISRIRDEGNEACLHVYSEKCKEKILIAWV